MILEQPEPPVRTGVWEHSSFRRDPVRRLQRTGLAAMVTVYGARSEAERMIAGVVRMHERVQGDAPDGLAYRANDVRLLTWVQATASYSFSEAYHRFVQPVSDAQRDAFYADSLPSARLYGAVGVPADRAQMDALFEAQRTQLEPSPIVFEFLNIMCNAPLLPAAGRMAESMLLPSSPAVQACQPLGLSPERLRGFLPEPDSPR